MATASTSANGQTDRRLQAAGALLVVGIAAGVFWRTAYPTIAWWDSAQYATAAATLGITGAPGSLILTLLGWPVAHLPLADSPAYRLNLLAGATGGAVTALVFLIALELCCAPNAGSTARLGSAGGIPRRSVGLGATVGAGFGALTFAFSGTLWQYATQFTPYSLSAVFTGLVLLALLRWWDEAVGPDAWRWLAVVALLFGLDFSVHRTNALLIPGALVWVALRAPRTFVSPRAWLGASAGLAVGLAGQLLLIPIAAMTRSPLIWNEPSTWPRFWDYVSLKSLGGSFLINMWPRKSDLWSVQIADVARVVSANFLRSAGGLTPVSALPGIAALLGWLLLLRRRTRLAIAFMLALLLQAIGTVVYFNIPANFFRTFDRHYLPVCVTLAVLLAYGLAAAMEEMARLRWRRVGALAGGGVLALLPCSRLAANWHANDASRRWFARDFAANMLRPLPPNAILFTVGDNDTFPLLYLQGVEHVRPDVTLINLSVAYLRDFAAQQLRREPAFPFSLSRAARDSIEKQSWSPLAMTLPVEGTPEALGLATGTAVPVSISVLVKPQSAPGGMTEADVSLLDIVRTNRWHRPLAFAVTGAEGSMSWLATYGRQDGLFWRIVPAVNPAADRDRLRSALIAQATYRGYVDATMALDDVTRGIGYQTFSAFRQLIDADRAAGDLDRCRSDTAALLTAIPPERLAIPGVTAAVLPLCVAG